MMRGKGIRRRQENKLSEIGCSEIGCFFSATMQLALSTGSKGCLKFRGGIVSVRV